MWRCGAPWCESRQGPAHWGFHGQSSDIQHLESCHHTVLLCQNPAEHTNSSLEHQEVPHQRAFWVQQYSVSRQAAGVINVFKEDLHTDKTLCNVHGSWRGCHGGTLWQCGSVLCWLSCSWLNTGRRVPSKRTGYGTHCNLLWRRSFIIKTYVYRIFLWGNFTFLNLLMPVAKGEM